MIVGEDKNKVRNLVLPHIDKFHDVYRKVLKGSNVLHCSPDLKTFQVRLMSIVETRHSVRVSGIQNGGKPKNVPGAGRKTNV